MAIDKKGKLKKEQTPEEVAEETIMDQLRVTHKHQKETLLLFQKVFGVGKDDDNDDEEAPNRYPLEQLEEKSRELTVQAQTINYYFHKLIQEDLGL